MEAIILQFFESIRNPVLDVVFGVFSILGEALFVGAVAIMLFWLAPRRAGEMLVVTALTSFPLNSLLKLAVARPRPYSAGVVEYGKPFLGAELDEFASFPSGHTQSVSSLAFACASRGKSKKKRIAFYIVAAVAVLLVMVARMYFGAHYPTDVLAGLLLGLFVAVFWIVVYRYAYNARLIILLLLAALFIIGVPFAPSHDFLQAAGLLSGAAIALALGHFILVDKEHAPFPRRLWRIPVGLALMATVFALTLFFPEGEVFTLLKWFLLAFAAGACAPAIFQQLNI